MSGAILEVLIPNREGRRKVEICYVNGRFFASKSDSAYLETDARVFIQRSAPSTSEESSNSNSHQKSWQFNSNLCPILPELVAVLVEFGYADVFRMEDSEDSTKKKSLKIEEIPFEDSKEFRTKRFVVRDFWRKGYYLTDGTRFGGHYLVYTASPNECHAEFVLLCTPITDDERIAAMRCCNQVKKTLILATTSSESTKPHYTKCEWFRPEMF